MAESTCCYKDKVELHDLPDLSSDAQSISSHSPPSGRRGRTFKSIPFSSCVSLTMRSNPGHVGAVGQRPAGASVAASGVERRLRVLSTAEPPCRTQTADTDRGCTGMWCSFSGQLKWNQNTARKHGVGTECGLWVRFPPFRSPVHSREVWCALPGLCGHRAGPSRPQGLPAAAQLCGGWLRS